MALKFLQSDSAELEVKKILFSDTQQAFILKDDNGIDLPRFSYPLRRDETYNTSYDQFRLFLFHKDSFAANDIYQVKINERRIGWLFPIQAMTSNEHDHATNQHFFPYSFNAYKILLWNKLNLPYNLMKIEENPTLEDLYGENTIVLILFKRYLQELRNSIGKEFSIDHYLVSLYQHGYTFLSNTNFSNLHSYQGPSTHSQLPNGQAIHLSGLSGDIVNEMEYLNSLIQGLIKLENHPLVKFHLLYSVIELFISKIFDFEFNRTLASFQQSQDFYESKESLSELANEKQRIRKLFTSKCPGLTSSNTDTLRGNCNHFLQFVFGHPFTLTHFESLYKVRSTLFHNLRKVPSNYETHLNSIVASMEQVILEICVKFSLNN